MKKRSYLIRRCLMLLILVTVLVCLCDSPVQAQRNREPDVPKAAISEEDQSWSGWPWLVGGVLVGGTMAIGLKNAKRSHLD
ncbi:MAG: hypothetical protein K9M57_05320 [Phycisphaerae bacterium]|nr:hypothetical protein [Phycisphaerae bacterium]